MKTSLKPSALAATIKYGLVSAQVLGFASEVEPLPANKYKKKPSHRRIHELRLLTISRELKALRLQTPGPEERISALPRDEMLLLYTIQGKALDELVWIENHTTGKSCLLQKPGAKARSAGVTTGIATFFAGGVLAMLVHLPDKLASGDRCSGSSGCWGLCHPTQRIQSQG